MIWDAYPPHFQQTATTNNHSACCVVRTFTRHITLKVAILTSQTLTKAFVLSRTIFAFFFAIVDDRPDVGMQIIDSFESVSFGQFSILLSCQLCLGLQTELSSASEVLICFFNNKQYPTVLNIILALLLFLSFHAPTRRRQHLAPRNRYKYLDQLVHQLLWNKMF